MKIAFITGITGQDGSYLAELLLEKKYIVYGMIRRSTSINKQNIDHIFSKLKIFYGDLTDYGNINSIFAKIKDENKDMERLEIYNLGAQTNVLVSFDMPEYTGNVDALGTLRLLECIRSNNLTEKTRFFQASTSELYGKSEGQIFSEETVFYPRSPYGVAKLYGYWIVKNYRESYNIYACSGILFNHESPRRGHNFVTRKVTIGLGKILRGESTKLVMGNIDSIRDWGYAEDYVEGMWKMLQNDIADDFILATGETYTIRQFIEEAFSLRGFNIKWKGEGINEIGYDELTNRELIFIDSFFFRPVEVERIIGDATKAKNILGWVPKTTFKELVKKMVDSDCKKL